MKRKVDVSLLGHRFSVRVERDEAWVHTLAGYVTKKVDEVRRQTKNVTPHEALLLAALQLADELFEETEKNAQARAELRSHTEAMVQKLSAALGDDERDEEQARDVVLERRL